jgi:hypothetical protein
MIIKIPYQAIRITYVRGADKSSAFPICSTTKRIFLGWVKEVRTMKYKVCGAQGEYVE